MKCVLATSFTKEFGEVNDVLKFSTEELKPSLDPKKNQMLVKVLTCSIAAGDTLVLGGNFIFLRPKLPYIPGQDVCGVVEEVTEKVKGFKVGDTVVANNGVIPVGGMAEYMVVNPALAALKPPSVDIIQAAAASISAVTAVNAVDDYVKTGNRVLILGGSGGVGSAAITLAKIAGASFVATTSTQKEMCISLGADEVINYREKNWWEVEEFQQDKFDKIIDTAGGGNFYGRAERVLKTGSNGGYFIAVTGDDPRPDLGSWFNVIKFFFKMAGPPLWTWIRKRTYPKYVMFMTTDETKNLAKVLKLMEEGKLKIALDPSSPHEFSEQGVKDAFKIQGSGHAHGKVVVKMSDKE